MTLVSRMAVGVVNLQRPRLLLTGIWNELMEAWTITKMGALGNYFSDAVNGRSENKCGSSERH